MKKYVLDTKIISISKNECKSKTKLVLNVQVEKNYSSEVLSDNTSIDKNVELLAFGNLADNIAKRYNVGDLIKVKADMFSVTEENILLIPSEII